VFRQCGPIHLGLPAEAKEEEQRQTGLVRAHTFGYGEIGASPAPGA
jgi:hypothetical protein